MRLLWLLLLPVLLFTISGTLVAETWQNAQLLNQPSQTNAKSSRICGNADGGFSATYISGGALRYKRYQGGILGSEVTVATGTIYNVQIANAGNNDIHIVWEDWSNPGIPIGWAKSTNGGVSFSRSYVPHNNTKYPYIAPFGPAGSSTMITTAGAINYPSAGNNNMDYAVYNGSSWTSTTHLTAVDSEYSLEGMARSPVDGSVWKCYNGNDDRLYLRRFNGTSWEAPILFDSESMFRAKQSLAINSVGEIMCSWTTNYGQRAKVYSPSMGAGPLIDFGTSADSAEVIGIPGRAEFYMVSLSNSQVQGRRYFQGSFDPPVVVNTGLASGFYPEVNLSAAADGTLYCCFEFWGSNDAQQYYTYCTNFTTSDPTPPVFNGPVYDDGASQDVASFLHATWTAASDPESGIHHYEYSIGTSPGATNAVGWTRGDAALEMLHTGAFAPGTYYINIKAVSNGGLESQSVSSDGIQLNVAANPASFSAPAAVDWSSRACANAMLTKANDGGLHLVYDITDPYIHYRKLRADGTWADAVGFTAGKFPDIAEDTTGKLHCVYTTADGRENLPLAEAINTGGIWGTGTTIYNNMNWYPRIVAGQAGKIHLIDNSTSSHNVKFATKDTSWPALTDLGTSARYGTPDMAVGTDGVIRAVWVSGNDLVYRTYNGSSWSAQTVISNSTGYIMPRIALDSTNKPYVVWLGGYWLKGYRVYFTKLDGSSWSAPKLIGYGHYPSIAVDKSDRVHVVWSIIGNNGTDDIEHAVFNGSQWSGTINISNNSGASLRPAIEVTNDGRVHVAWQDDTGSSVANIQYSGASLNAPPSFAACSISAPVLYADDTTQYTVSLTVNDVDGTGDIKDMRILLNIDTAAFNQALARGYLAWGQTANDVTYYGGSWTVNAASGGGYWGFYNNGWGYQYITPVSCSTSTNGSQRTVTWTFKARPLWASTGPLAGNYIGVYTRDTFANSGWQRSDALFGLTFGIAQLTDTGCGEARTAPEDSAANLVNKTVTAIFADQGCIYVEDENHSAGIRVLYAGTDLTIGDKVDVVGGVVDTIAASERQITGAVVNKLSSGSAAPAAVSCKAVGGSATAYFAGVKNGTGANNIGLLVKITGQVKKIDGDFIYVDDGSGVENVLADGTSRVGVKVKYAGTPGVSEGDIVGVTGIIQGSMPAGWTANQSYIRCRIPSDIQLYKSGTP